MRLGDDRDLADEEPVPDDGAGLEVIRKPRRSATRLSVSGPRYEIGAMLGAGGMAEVFAGSMIGAEGFVRRVAIKRVRPTLSQVPAFSTMFVAEARIASQLSHPNVVSVLDLRRDSRHRLFLVMELVEGKDLASLLDAGPISPSLAIFIVIELLRGLGHVHALADPDTGTLGVVHRDVSPQNLLLSYEGAVKVSDFGLAKALAAGDAEWSATVRGKPSYMSPEQLTGGLLDGRTDLYAVGVMLWEMLAHRPLFAGTMREILGQVMFRGIEPPGRLRRGVPADLEAIAMTLLSRERDHRFATAEAAVEALLQCKDMPRDGRGELVHVLADRFPRVGVGARRSVPARSAVHPAREPQVTVEVTRTMTASAAGVASGPAFGPPVCPTSGEMSGPACGLFVPRPARRRRSRAARRA